MTYLILNTLFASLILAGLAVYQTLVQLAPVIVSSMNSNGFTSLVQANMGTRFLKWQKMFFATYHRTQVNWWTHVLSFEVDYFAWFYLTRQFGLEAIVETLLLIQAFSFKKPSLIAAMIAHMLLVIALVNSILPMGYTMVAWSALLVTCFLRCMAHGFEKLPCHMFEKNGKFIESPFERNYGVWFYLKASIIGSVSELQAGFVLRLHYCVIDFLLEQGVSEETKKAAEAMFVNGFSPESLLREYEAIRLADAIGEFSCAMNSNNHHHHQQVMTGVVMNTGMSSATNAPIASLNSNSGVVMGRIVSSQQQQQFTLQTQEIANSMVVPATVEAVVMSLNVTAPTSLQVEIKPRSRLSRARAVNLPKLQIDNNCTCEELADSPPAKLISDCNSGSSSLSHSHQGNNEQLSMDSCA